MTKEQAIELLKQKLEKVKDYGPEDQGAWEYRGDILTCIELIEEGGDIDTIVSNV